MSRFLTLALLLTITAACAEPARVPVPRMDPAPVSRIDPARITVSGISAGGHPGAILNLVPGFKDPAVGGIWGDKIYRNPGEVISGEGEGLYLRYEKFSKRCENRLGSIVSAEGSMRRTTPSSPRNLRS